MSIRGLRPCVAIAASVSSFALLVETAGLIPAVIAAVLIASRASATIRVRQAVLLSLCLAAATALLFVGVLNQPFRLAAGF